MEGLVYRTAVQSAADPFEFVLSDETVDRMGDVIAADGWDLKQFKNNPIALFNHNANAIIGRWEKVRLEGKRLIGKLVLASAGTSQLVDEVRKLWDQKMVRAVSVGFRPVKSEPLNKKDDDDDDPFFFGPTRYLQSELVECSLVAVPANPNALPLGKSLELSADVRRQLFGKPATQERQKSQPADPRVPAKPPNGGKPMSMSKRIETAQNELNSHRDKLAELSKIEEPGDDDAALIDELMTNQIPAAQQNLERLERMEKALAVRTIEHDPNEKPKPEPARPFAVPKKKIEPVDFLVRSVSTIVMAVGRRESLGQVLANTYGNDEATGIVLRAATGPALTTQVGWAAELVETVNAEFLDRLMPDAIYPRLAARGARFTFGRAGAIKIPARASTPTLAGAWVGEGAPKPVKQAAFTTVTLLPTKLAVISLFTEEIAEHSTPAIEQIIRDAMRDDTSAAIDGFLIDNVAGSATRPPGLLNGLTTLTPSAAANATDKMIADLKALIGAIVAANGGRSIVLLMNPAQALGINFATTSAGLLFSGTDEAGRRFGVDILVSNTVPAGTVIAVDAADFASATGDVPRYSISDQATVHQEDTSPLALATGPQGTAVVATPMRSLWQTDTIGVRMTWPIHWRMRRAGMVAFMSGVTW